VAIFTISDNVQVNQLTADALIAYKQRRWQESESLWRQVLAVLPGDNISTLYLDRIAEFRVRAPAVDWDGAVALDKL
jgi:hypothetical protein